MSAPTPTRVGTPFGRVARVGDDAERARDARARRAAREAVARRREQERGRARALAARLGPAARERVARVGVAEQPPSPRRRPAAARVC